MFYHGLYDNDGIQSAKVILILLLSSFVLLLVVKLLEQGQSSTLPSV